MKFRKLIVAAMIVAFVMFEIKIMNDIGGFEAGWFLAFLCILIILAVITIGITVIVCLD